MSTKRMKSRHDKSDYKLVTKYKERDFISGCFEPKIIKRVVVIEEA